MNAVLIGPEHSGPLACVTFPTVLKSFAYHMGSHALDALLGVYNSNVALSRPRAFPPSFPRMAQLRIDCQGGGRRKADPS